MKKYYRRLTGCILLYLALYALNSTCGEYRVVASGNTRKAFGRPTGVSMPDVAHWFPLVGRFDFYKTIHGKVESRGSFFGYLFCPLIHMDRTIWHHSKKVINDDGFPLSIEHEVGQAELFETDKKANP